MRRFLPLLGLLCAAGLAFAGVAQAAPAPTCLLSELTLLTNSNAPLQIRDSDGLGYNHASNVYFCNCDNTVDTVRVKLTSDQTSEKKTGYWLEFKNGEGQEFEQDLFNGVLSTPLHFRPDLNRIIIHAFSPTCTKKVTIHCTQTPEDGEAIGDPQFAGLRGQDYQVHGVSGEVYNIITDEHMQMNSKFVFLDQGECPTFNGERALGCFSHPGSYLGEIGIKTANGDRVKIVSGDYKTGFASIELNGQKMEPGQTATLPADNGMNGFVTFNHSFVVTVQAGNFLLQFENSDMFINQRVRVLDWSKLSSHGLLGQTWRTVEYKNAIKYVEGQVDDYVVEGKDLFGDKFVFNRFEQRGEGQAMPRVLEQAEQAAQNELVSSLPQQMERMPELIADIVNEGSSFVADLVSSAQQAILGRHEEGGPSALELAIPPSDDPDVLVAEIKEGAYEQDPLDATAAGQIMGGAPAQRETVATPVSQPEVLYGEEEAYVLTAEIKEGAYFPDPLDATAAGRRLGITTPQLAQESVIVEVKPTGEEPTFAVAVEPAQDAAPPAHSHGRRRRRSVQLVEN